MLSGSSGGDDSDRYLLPETPSVSVIAGKRQRRDAWQYGRSIADVHECHATDSRALTFRTKLQGTFSGSKLNVLANFIT